MFYKLNVRAGIILCILLACGFRLYGLAAQSLWTDEIFEAASSRKDLLSILNTNASSLRFVIIHFFMLIGQGEFFVRFPSAGAGILGVAMIYLVGKELFDVETGIIGAFLLAMSAFHIAYSQEARSYSLTVLLVLTSLYFLLRALQHNRWRYWAGFAVTSAASLDNHMMTAIVLASEAIFASLVLLSDRLSGKVNVTNIVSWRRLSIIHPQDLVPTRAKMNQVLQRICLLKETRFVIGVLFCLILFLPLRTSWFSYLFAEIGVNLGDSASLNDNYAALRLSGDFVVRLLTEYGAGNGAALYLFGGAFVAGLIAEVFRRHWARTLLVVIWIVFPFLALPLISTSEPRFHLRHLIFILPVFLIVVARGIANIGRFLGQLVGKLIPAGRGAASGISLALLIITFGWQGVDAAQAYYNTQKEDWRGVAMFLREHAAPGDLIFQLSLWPRNGIPYYLGGYLSDANLAYLDVFDAAKLSQGALANVWWVLRTEEFEGPLHPERIAQVQTYLGSEFDLYPFARIAIIHRKTPFVSLDDFLQTANGLLLTEMQFDREDFRSSYAWAWYALGDAEYKIRNLTRAAEYYTHGINAAPGVADGYILLGNVRYKQDRPDEALRLLDRATEVNPPYGVPRMLRWRVLREQGRGAEARDDFQQALTLLGRRWIELVSLQLSDMLIGHGQVDDAIQVLWEVQERVPDSGKLHLYLGRAYLAKAQGDTEGRLTYLNLAQSELDEAERLLPEGPELSSARMNLAQAQRTAP